MADEEQVTPEEGELSLDSAVESGDHEGHSQSDNSDVSADKRVRDAQSKMHEEAQKRAELERQIEKMNGQLSVLTELVGKNGQQAPAAPQENPFQFLDDDKFKESLLDSGESVATAMKRVVGEIGRTLHLRDQMLLQELNQRDPEVRSATEQIKSFRSENPDLNDLTDQQIMKVLKKTSQQPASSEESKKKVLSIGSRPVSTGQDDEMKKEIDMWYNKIGYNIYAEIDKRRKK